MICSDEVTSILETLSSSPEALKTVKGAACMRLSGRIIGKGGGPLARFRSGPVDKPYLGVAKRTTHKPDSVPLSRADRYVVNSSALTHLLPIEVCCGRG